MVGEVEVRCVGPGMQGVCVEVCVHLCWCFSATQKRSHVWVLSLRNV